eukprot:358198-Chlamydomonas_euryale.AAC.10
MQRRARPSGPPAFIARHAPRCFSARRVTCCRCCSPRQPIGRRHPGVAMRGHAAEGPRKRVSAPSTRPAASTRPPPHHAVHSARSRVGVSGMDVKLCAPAGGAMRACDGAARRGAAQRVGRTAFMQVSKDARMRRPPDAEDTNQRRHRTPTTDDPMRHRMCHRTEASAEAPSP